MRNNLEEGRCTPPQTQAPKIDPVSNIE